MVAGEDRRDNYHMDAEECWEQLREHPTHVGRLAFWEDDEPTILPLNYRVTGTSIVFRTSPGGKLAAVVDKQVVAFEVDEVDAGWQTGWSVLARGRPRVAEDDREVHRLGQLGLLAWSSGQQDHWVVLEPTHISGRQVT